MSLSKEQRALLSHVEDGFRRTLGFIPPGKSIDYCMEYSVDSDDSSKSGSAGSYQGRLVWTEAEYYKKYLLRSMLNRDSDGIYRRGAKSEKGKMSPSGPLRTLKLKARRIDNNYIPTVTAEFNFASDQVTLGTFKYDVSQMKLCIDHVIKSVTKDGKLDSILEHGESESHSESLMLDGIRTYGTPGVQLLVLRSGNVHSSFKVRALTYEEESCDKKNHNDDVKALLKIMKNETLDKF